MPSREDRLALADAVAALRAQLEEILDVLDEALSPEREGRDDDA
jgi:hypothetical protein